MKRPTRAECERWADDALAVIYRGTGTLAPLKRRPPRRVVRERTFIERYLEAKYA